MVAFKGRACVLCLLMDALIKMELSVADFEMSLRQLARKDMQASSKASVISDTFMVECLGFSYKILLYIQKQILRLHRETG